MLDVTRSPELQAAILGMKRAERELRLDINKEARSELRPLWLEALRGHAETLTDFRIIIDGARVAAGTRQVSLKAATSNRPRSGGLVPSRDFAAQEFGMRNHLKTFTTTSPLGKRYQVTKVVGRQFPSRQRYGRVANAAASVVGRRLVAIWVRIIVDNFRAFSDVTAR